MCRGWAVAGRGRVLVQGPTICLPPSPSPSPFMSPFLPPSPRSPPLPLTRPLSPPPYSPHFQVGCGKSSLLQALLGEMIQQHGAAAAGGRGGAVIVKGSVAYTSQVRRRECEAQGVCAACVRVLNQLGGMVTAANESTPQVCLGAEHGAVPALFLPHNIPCSLSPGAHALIRSSPPSPSPLMLPPPAGPLDSEQHPAQQHPHGQRL